uniref:Uncharacterized protein n=1 Tax=Norrisiella sphaerica TaxID=552664 RepID=A0A7S2QSI1_9EUKA|eukprot:CAMPEP_0184481588 /NCGR_PEP_ID=MMETSP0113_2-20130426/3145_1 /TAXON_ID=91329 /ORGANISM="Norrisiella sphaerica, Strain BC52" /LENGTH=327 /DNA_ID=CAMNT_0026860803 /DNA_START=30 /DNA_END=1013 /DNA_ORIENTATION=-
MASSSTSNDQDPVGATLADIFSYKSLVHAIAGATGGVTAISVFFPLNTARIRIQVASHEEAKGLMQTIIDTIEDDGFQALYQGWKSAVMAIGSSNFVYFYTYNLLKLAYRKNTGNKQLTTGANLLIASLSGVANVLLTSPIWTVNTRLVVQRKKGMKAGADESKSTQYDGILDAFKRIIEKEGVAGLWSGVVPSLWLVSNPSVQFVVYEQVRLLMDGIATKRGRRITPIEFFLMGAIAKAAATIVTYPLQLAQSKLRVDKDRKYKGTVDVMFKIYQKSGLRGLFQGVNAKLWQTVLTAAFQFLTYEEVKYFVFLLLLGPKKVPKASE